MAKHTIELEKEEVKTVKVVQAVNEFKSIDKAVGFIIKDYAEKGYYSDFIKKHEERGKNEKKK